MGAKAGIYHLISDLSKEKAVVVVSSDVEEVFGLCDRILVIYRGRVVMDKPASKTRLDEMLVFALTGGAQHANE